MSSHLNNTAYEVLENVRFHAYVFLLVYATLRCDLSQELSLNLMLGNAVEYLLNRFIDIKEKTFHTKAFISPDNVITQLARELPDDGAKSGLLKAAEAKIQFVNFAVFIALVYKDINLAEASLAFFTKVMPRDHRFTINMLMGYIDLRTRDMVNKISERCKANDEEEVDVVDLMEEAYPTNSAGYNVDDEHPVLNLLLSIAEKRLQEIDACQDVETLQAMYSRNAVNQKWKIAVCEFLERDGVMDKVGSTDFSRSESNPTKEMLHSREPLVEEQPSSKRKYDAIESQTPSDTEKPKRKRGELQKGDRMIQVSNAISEHKDQQSHAQVASPRHQPTEEQTVNDLRTVTDMSFMQTEEVTLPDALRNSDQDESPSSLLKTSNFRDVSNCSNEEPSSTAPEQILSQSIANDPLGTGSQQPLASNESDSDSFLFGLFEQHTQMEAQKQLEAKLLLEAQTFVSIPDDPVSSNTMTEHIPQGSDTANDDYFDHPMFDIMDNVPASDKSNTRITLQKSAPFIHRGTARPTLDIDSEDEDDDQPLPYAFERSQDQAHQNSITSPLQNRRPHLPLERTESANEEQAPLSENDLWKILQNEPQEPSSYITGQFTSDSDDEQVTTAPLSEPNLLRRGYPVISLSPSDRPKLGRSLAHPSYQLTEHAPIRSNTATDPSHFGFEEDSLFFSSEGSRSDRHQSLCRSTSACLESQEIHTNIKIEPNMDDIDYNHIKDTFPDSFGIQIKIETTD